MNLFDLQIQTPASDGRHSSREIVKMAYDLGVKTIAITDHDTIAGVEEALLVGGEYGIRVIPGVEMSVEENNSHILGFGVDFRNEKFLAVLDTLRQGRIESLKKLVENLKINEGFIIEWEDVLKEAGGATTIASPHVVYAVLNRSENKEKLERDGVKQKFEFFNPSHTEDDVEFLESLVHKYNLLRTGGSDFHDAGTHVRSERGLHSADMLGDYDTYGFSTDDIIVKLDEAIMKQKA